MAEYIERQTMLEDFESCNRSNPKWTPQRVKTLIVRQPPTDAAPVIRCKDCKYSRGRNELEMKFLCEGVLVCTNIEASDDGWNSVFPDHFCSYGKNKYEVVERNGEIYTIKARDSDE